MTDDQVKSLRSDTRNLFYHGFHNYMNHAFPEDELKPISCKPQTRNKENPADIGLNDVLGNYSLTLIDSLSTLAILASGGQGEETEGATALRDFQNGVESLVDLYGDGKEAHPCGNRACGFDLDSKVQVFETNIRGVGGLLSAHLFAAGDLPITGYAPEWIIKEDGFKGTQWSNGLLYDGQLLRLAYDLATRLLPAFNTATGLPYPRVNLRHGIPFYQDSEDGVCRLDGTSSDPREITETCTAGAGSLVLEFTTLSRLTGDPTFERLAKKAFWAVWERRSSIGLLGGGLDAENGLWTAPPLAGIGAGVDSFFEYALKSSILLSGLPYNTSVPELDAPDSFLQTWQQAHGAVKRHVRRGSTSEKHPYYSQSDPHSGAPRFSWIDNLSAYYPGLLTLAGELEEAIESHLLFTALWTRYAALPERWHAFNAFIDPNFKHWAGRPEFIESTYYLYQTTKDPWFLHTGEMALKDIRRRCWTRCGWADLGDVVSGEQRDRMESFFLGETAKYLYLLFNERHPLNTMDGSVVFTTEGHPLIIPKVFRKMSTTDERKAMRVVERQTASSPAPTCPAPGAPLPLTVSNVANRADLFHAAALAQLHLVPVQPSRSTPLEPPSLDSPGISIGDVRSPTNYTFYPWTLPPSLIPSKGMSSPITNPVVQTLTFPNFATGDANAEKGLIPMGALQKMLDGVLVNGLSNLRLNMVQQPKSLLLPDDQGVMVEVQAGQEFRIHGIANWALGRDEKVLLSKGALEGVSPADPHFTKVKDLEMVDLVLDVPFLTNWPATTAINARPAVDTVDEVELEVPANSTLDGLWDDIEKMFSGLLSDYVRPEQPATSPAISQIAAERQPNFSRTLIPAILPTGIGHAPLPASMDSDPLGLESGHLPFKTIYFLDDTLCHHRLPAAIAKVNNVLIIKRGDCSFNDKLEHIPSFAPSEQSLQLVLIVSGDEAKSQEETLKPQGELIRPLLDKVQKTPHGFDRRHPIAMTMLDGTPEIIEALKSAASVVASFDEAANIAEHKVQSKSTDASPGLGVKRRYWFESMGVPIGNLIVL